MEYQILNNKFKFNRDKNIGAVVYIGICINLMRDLILKIKL